jgi:hypothetical protein
MTMNKLQGNLPQEAGEFPLPASGISLECWLKSTREEAALVRIRPLALCARDHLAHNRRNPHRKAD